MNDSKLKDQLYAHTLGRGWYSLLEVPVFHRGGPAEDEKLVTDIDVFSLRPSECLTWSIVLGDCKTLRNQSAANRALWLRGLIAYFGAAEGIIVLRKLRPVEADHTLFASSIGVTVLTEDDFPRFDRAIVYPRGSQHLLPHSDAARRLQTYCRREDRLRELAAFLFGGAWNYQDPLGIPRRLLGEVRAIAGELDPAKPEDVGVALFAASVFAVGFAAVVGVLFLQHLQPDDRQELDHGLRPILWGGRVSHAFMSSLFQRLEDGTERAREDVALPEWDRFLELVRNALEFPALAYDLPRHLLSHAHTRFVPDAPGLPVRNRLLSAKFCMLLVVYVGRASGLPNEFVSQLEQIFVREQTEIVQRSRARDLNARGSSAREVSQGRLPIEGLEPSGAPGSARRRS